VADPAQASIMLDNARAFLEKDGYAIIAIKSQSIDVSKDASQTYEEVLKKLRNAFQVIQKIDLTPFDKDHLFVVLQFKG
jgi:fibrillarin-like pre-rRNA processing protein